jgi:GNAT superfamily N-acetyltransferase
MAKPNDKKKKKKKAQGPKISAHRLILRNTQVADYDDIRAIMDKVYSNMGGAWTREQFTAQIKTFPEGQICIEDKGRVVAAAIAVIVDYDKYGDKHTYWEITGNGFFTTHDPEGDTLYGVDIFVHPEYRDMRLGRRLYDARKALCERLNLRRIVAGGRIPGYAKLAAKMSPTEYIELVKRKEIRDPILSFQLANDFHVRRLITGYMPEDLESGAYATLIEWINIHFREEETRKPNAPIMPAKERVRVGAVQWQMRAVRSLQELLSPDGVLRRRGLRLPGRLHPVSRSFSTRPDGPRITNSTDAPSAIWPVTPRRSAGDARHGHRPTTSISSPARCPPTKMAMLQRLLPLPPRRFPRWSARRYTQVCSVRLYSANGAFPYQPGATPQVERAQSGGLKARPIEACANPDRFADIPRTYGTGLQPFASRFP